MKIITFKVEDKIYNSLKQQAESVGLSLSALIRLIILTKSDEILKLGVDLNVTK